MRDPHVASLRYRLVPGETISFDRPRPVERETKAFRLRVENDVATFELKEHHPDEETAKGAVEPFVRAWEIQTWLDWGHAAVRFVFQGADVVDRHPSRQQRGRVLMRETRTATAKAHIVRPAEPRDRYPELPDCFSVSPDVETM
jgi:hypothetical protein